MKTTNHVIYNYSVLLVMGLRYNMTPGEMLDYIENNPDSSIATEYKMETVTRSIDDVAVKADEINRRLTRLF